MTEKKTAFKPRHMEQLRRLGMGGYPCATFAAQEIEQLNEYAYALEVVLLLVFKNEEKVRDVVADLRERFAPDVEFPEVPRKAKR